LTLNPSKGLSQGWIRTLREALGMTSTQLARRMGMSQPRVIQMEKNEQNLKISTLEKAANAMGCKLLYVLVPQEPIERIIHERAHAAAERLFHKVNMNMALENQRVDSKEMIEDIAKELLDGSLSKIWED